jgi:hypothetical protein
MTLVSKIRNELEIIECVASAYEATKQYGCANILRSVIENFERILEKNTKKKSL